MEPYLKSIVSKWQGNLTWKDIPTDEFLKYALLGWYDQYGLSIISQWFTNCKMFHQQNCELCEYRFHCYTR